VGAAGRGASGGAAASVDGAMVDEAMVRRADRVLALPESETPVPMAAPGARTLAAPYFEELQRGATFAAPAVTLTGGKRRCTRRSLAIAYGWRSMPSCTRR
jgi:hypothetical protein